MEWCSYCKKYTESRIEKIEIHAIKKIFLTYHCLSCNTFIKTEEMVMRELCDKEDYAHTECRIPSV